MQDSHYLFAVVWFRRDLRVDDNPALRAAMDSGLPVLPVFVHDDAGEGRWPPGGATRWWRHHALVSLGEALEKLGLRLHCLEGETIRVFEALVGAVGAVRFFWNRRYEPEVIQRDERLKGRLKALGCAAQSFRGSLLFEPWTVQNKSGKPFQVFTPFRKHCLSTGLPEAGIQRTSGKVAAAALPDGVLADFERTVDGLKLLPTLSWDSGFRPFWNPSLDGAREALEAFVQRGIDGYNHNRDRPDLDGTSRLSPFLAHGQLSPAQVVSECRRQGRETGPGASRFLAEIGWREFSYHLLYHFPETPELSLRREFEAFPWHFDEDALGRWQRGQTGYPIVDAGMRQLWSTGWQHNRVRMICASFLVKHLLQPWQEGARWFWDTLVDADLASNTQGWQWTAGCGADAAPYFRIFNPIIQGAKFDPKGDYVRKWVPELGEVPTKHLFAPWEAPDEVLGKASVRLGTDYPAPIVNHQSARQRALDAFDQVKKTGQAGL